MRGNFFFKIATFLCVAAFSVVFSACSNDIDSMIEEYNKNFKKPDLSKDLLPGDVGFDQTTMLKERYTVATDESMTITAPKARVYRWSLYRVEIVETKVGVYTLIDTKKTEVLLSSSFGVSCDRQVLQLTKEKLQECLDVGTYELRLTVFAGVGGRYDDVAQLYVVKQFYEYY